MPMKAVDIIAEFEEKYVFVEVKNISEHKNRNDLKNSLKYKYRDSYLFRHAEDKVEKPVHYICLLAGFDNAQSLVIQKTLRRELPVGKASERWKRSIVESCQVLNMQKWKDNFHKWKLNRFEENEGSFLPD